MWGYNLFLIGLGTWGLVGCWESDRNDLNTAALVADWSVFRPRFISPIQADLNHTRSCYTSRMMEVSNEEAKIFWRYITSSIDRLMSCLVGLDKAQLNWKPLPIGNSLYVLAVHTLANTEENMLGVLCNEQIVRQREVEFQSSGVSSEVIKHEWDVLREQIEEKIVMLSSNMLDKKCNHPRRGTITGREVLLIVARHCAEHLGQAELTRDLLLATKT